MPGMDTTDIPAIMVDTTAVDTMEAGEDITDTLTDTDTDTDGANRQKQITSQTNPSNYQSQTNNLLLNSDLEKS